MREFFDGARDATSMKKTTRTLRTLMIALGLEIKGKEWQGLVRFVHKFLERHAVHAAEFGKLDAHAQTSQGIDDFALARNSRVARAQMERNRDLAVRGEGL